MTQRHYEHAGDQQNTLQTSNEEVHGFFSLMTL